MKKRVMEQQEAPPPLCSRTGNSSTISPHTGEFFWSKLRGKGTFKEGRGPPEGRLLRRKHFRNLKEK
jgi:hypothetical protein